MPYRAHQRGGQLKEGEAGGERNRGHRIRKNIRGTGKDKESRDGERGIRRDMKGIEVGDGVETRMRAQDAGGRGWIAFSLARRTFMSTRGETMGGLEGGAMIVS